MRVSPFLSAVRQGALLALLLGAAASGHAQTAPAWQSARTVGSGSFFTTSVVSAVDAVGNVYHAGSFLGSVTVSGVVLSSLGNADAYLAKFAPNGSLLWLQQLGSSGDESLADMALDAAGNAYLTGTFTTSLALSPTVGLTGNGVSAAFLLRYSPAGTAEWAQSSAASTAPCNGSGVRADNAGHVFLTGYFANTLSFGPTSLANAGSAPAYWARFSAATGTPQLLVLAYAFPAGGGAFERPRVRVASSGAVYVVAGFYVSPTFGSGATLTSRGNRDVLVARYGAQGAVEWVQQLGGAGFDGVADGELDGSDNFYLTGTFNNTLMAGSLSLVSAGGQDGYLAKYSAQGAPQWLQALGGPGTDAWNDVGLDASAYPYVTGFFTGTAQVGPRVLAGVAGSADVAVAAYTPQGQVRWVTQAGGSGFDFGTLLRVNPAGEPLVFGYYGGPCSFGPYPLQPTAPQESFWATLGSTRVLATTPVRNDALAAYPNPAHDRLYLPALPAGTRVQLVDALGRVARETGIETAGTVSVRGLPPGLYTLRAPDAHGRPYARRLAVE